MTKLECLKNSQKRLKAAGLPTTEALWLVQKATGPTLPYHQPLSESQLQHLEGLLEQRLQRVPLQLLLGDTEFFGLHLEVRAGVLIPRPETEGLVELALAHLKPLVRPQVLDVGTGSGAIALSIAKIRPDATVWASDISLAALDLAQSNALALGLMVRFVLAAHTAGLSGLDMVVSNPPYLPEDYRLQAPPELAFEPNNALYAGPDGLAVARELLPMAAQALKPGGVLLLELDPSNVTQLAQEAQLAGWQAVQIHPDLSGRQRYLSALL